MSTPDWVAPGHNPYQPPSYQDTFGDISSLPQQLLKLEGSMLPEGFRDVQVWKDFWEAIEEVFGNTVCSLLRDLYGKMDLNYMTQSPTVDNAMLLRRAKEIGITYDLSTFEDQDIRNFIRHTPEFWPEKGARNFIQYASFVINASLKMMYLWSQDYIKFVPENTSGVGTPVYEGGTWYPTSHVFISYDVSKFSNSVNENFTSQDALAKFFYSIAPIHLVIKSFMLTHKIDFGPLYGAATICTRIKDKAFLEMPAFGRTDRNTLCKWDKGGTPVLLFDDRTMCGTTNLSPDGDGIESPLLLNVGGDGELLLNDGSPLLLNESDMGGVIEYGCVRTWKKESGRDFYVEIQVNSVETNVAGELYVGFANPSFDMSDDPGSDANSWVLNLNDGNFTHNGVATPTGLTFTKGDTVRFYVKASGQMWLAKNATWIGNPVAGTSPSGTGVSNVHLYFGSNSNAGIVTFAEPGTYDFTSPVAASFFGT